MPTIKGYIQDVNVPASFVLDRDCVDEIIYIDIYIIGSGKLANSPINVILPTLEIPNPVGLVKGSTKGTRITVPVNYSLIGAAGGNYSFIARTTETGVVYSSPLLIFAEDGYSVEGYSGNAIDPEAGIILKTDGDGTRFLNDQGQYVEVNAVAVTDNDFWKNDQSYAQDVAKLYTYNNITSWYISVVPSNENNIPRILSGVNEGDVNTDFWKLVTVETSQNLIKYATDSIFKATTTVVIKDSILYELVNATRPYLSTDFDAESTAGHWVMIGGGSNPTAGQIKTLYESNANTNAFTDAEKAKVASMDVTHYLTPLQNTTQLTALTEDSLTDKARVYVEDESSDFFYDAQALSGDFAPDDQTGATGFWRKVAVDGETAASIKTKYESNADTNAFTDAFYTILNAFTSSVLGVPLTGLSVTNAVVTATDTVLAAYGKLQGQINAILTALNGKVPITTPTALTDGVSVAVNCESSDNKQFTLAANNTTCTLALSNLVDGHTCQIIIAPQSTATFTFTFTHIGLTMKVADAGSAAWALDATSGKYYRVFVTRVGSNGFISFDSRSY